MLELRQLVIFQAIAETGSIAATARKLHFGQPTIAYHLRRLEQQLQSRLVERTPTGAKVTEAGSALLEYCDRLLGLAEEAASAVRSVEAARPLTVGTFRTAGAILLAPVVAQGRRASILHRDIALVHGSLQEHLAHVREERSDCAIVYSFGEIGDSDGAAEGLEVTPLSEDPYRVMVHRDNPLAGTDRTLRFAELSQQKWITRERAGEADDLALAAAAQRAGFEPQVVLEEDDYSVATAFLSEEGAILLPRLYRPGSSSLVDLEVVDDLGARRISFVSRSGRLTPETEFIRDGIAHLLTELLPAES